MCFQSIYFFLFHLLFNFFSSFSCAIINVFLLVVRFSARIMPGDAFFKTEPWILGYLESRIHSEESKTFYVVAYKRLKRVEYCNQSLAGISDILSWIPDSRGKNSRIAKTGLRYIRQIRSLSKDVFNKRRSSTGSGVFFNVKKIDATKFVFLRLFLTRGAPPACEARAWAEPHS